MSSANAARTEAVTPATDELTGSRAHGLTGVQRLRRPAPSAEALAYAGLSLATLCWASAFIAGKVALAEMSPLVVGAWRYAVASVVLLPFALRSRRLASFRGVGLPFAVMIVTGGLLYPLLFLVALQNTSATNTALLIALNPAFTTLLSPLIGEHLDRQRLAGIGLALLGAVTVITKGELSTLVALASNRLNHGDLLAVAAACSWASFNLASRRVVASLPPSVVNCTIYVTGGIAMFLLGLPEHPWTQLTSATPWAVASIVGMALPSSVIAGQLFLVGVGTVGVNRTVVFVYLVPVLTALLSTTILGESFGLSQAAGGTAVLAGVYLTTRAGRRS
jgi:drug/metabolite transporter (DMT)-like permease